MIRISIRSLLDIGGDFSHDSKLIVVKPEMFYQEKNIIQEQSF